MFSYVYQQMMQTVTPIYNKIVHYFPLYQGQIQAVRYLILLMIMIYTALVNTSMNPSVVQDKVFVGLAQPQLCTDQSSMYYVGSRGLFNGLVVSDDIINSTGDANIISNPIVYEIIDSSAYNENPSELSQYSQPCINMWQLSQCESTLETTEFLHQTVSMFTHSFQVPDHDYFPYIDAIVFSCMMSVYLIVYTGTHQEAQGQKRVTYVNDLIGVMLCYFLFQSATHHTVIYNEDCETMYPASLFTKGPNVCSLLVGCELVLKSVLDVRDDISQYYTATLYTLGIIWVTFLISHICCNSIYEYYCYMQDGVERRLQEEHDNILNKTGEALTRALEGVSLEFIDHYIKDWKYHAYFTARERSVNIRSGDDSGGSGSGGRSVAIPVETSDDEQLDKAECSICLCLLLSPLSSPPPLPLPPSSSSTADMTSRDHAATTPNTHGASIGLSHGAQSSRQTDQGDSDTRDGRRGAILEMTALSHLYRSSVGVLGRGQYAPLEQTPETDESMHAPPGAPEHLGFAKVIQLKCSHLFHQACILQWVAVNRNSICPVCRQPLRPEPLAQP